MRGNNSYVVYSAVVAAMLGINFGSALTIRRMLSGSVAAIESTSKFSDGIYDMLFFAGAFLSNIVSRFLHLNRLLVLAAADLFFISSYILLCLKNRSAIYSARLLMGLASGIVTANVPAYISIISPNAFRGVLTGFFSVSVVLGVTLGNILDDMRLHADHRIFLLCFLFSTLLHMFLLMTVLRNVSASATGIFSLLAHPKAARSILISACLFVSEHFTSINYLNLHLLSFFDSSYDPYFMGILTSLFCLAITLLAIVSVDSVGRKPLYILCAFMVSVANLSMAVGVCRQVMVFLILLGYNAGFATIPYIVSGELYPSKYTDAGAFIGTSFGWLSGVLTSLFVSRSTIKGVEIPFVVYALTTAFFGVLIFVLYKETRNKNPDFQ